MSTQFAALFPALIGVVMAFAAYAGPWPGGYPLANLRGGVALVTLLLLGMQVWYRPTSAPWAGGAREQLVAVVHVGVVLLATIETMAWCGRSEVAATTSLHHALTAVWCICALFSVVLARASSWKQVAHFGMVPLVLGLVSAFLLYVRSEPSIPLAANPRFLLVVLAVTVTALQRLAFTAGWLPSVVQLLAIAAVSCELIRWSSDNFSGDACAMNMLWSLSLAWTAAAGVGFRRWQEGGPAGAAWIGMVFASMAGVAMMFSYLVPWPADLPFLNLRFIGLGLVVAVLMLGRGVLRQRELEEDMPYHRVVGWFAVTLLFMGASCDPYSYFTDQVLSREAGQRLGIFSITVVWVVFAGVALTIGFIRRQRQVRLLALALFALTAVKLLVLDMNGIQQLYRILAFMLVGGALIAASYAYHRLERRYVVEHAAAKAGT